jgi:hypothetical protein
MVSPTQYLDYGALGAAMLVLLISVGVLFRALTWAHDLFEIVLARLQQNTDALVRLAEKLQDVEDRF